MITFGNIPAAFLFLLLPLFSIFWTWKGYAIRRALRGWMSPALQARLMSGGTERRSLVELLFWNVIASLLILALMDPRGNPRYLTVEKNVETSAGEIVFLIDASASMTATDTRTGQSRFEIAKEIAQQTIEQISGNSIALFAFTSQLTPMSPPTFDLLFVHMMVNQLMINEGDATGTDLYVALNDLLPTLAQSTTAKTVVLLTDGENTDQKPSENLDPVIDKMLQLNTNIEVVGVGSEKGKVIPGLLYEGKPVISVPDLTLLQRIAARGRGNYLSASSNSSLAVASELTSFIRRDNHGTMKIGSSSQAQVLYTHYRFYPIAAALILLLFYRLFPSFWIFVLLCTFQNTMSAESSYTHALHQLQAGDLPQAAREWGSLATIGKSPWEQGVSLYNLACVEIAEEKWRDALNTLDMISIAKTTPEYLTYHVLWNKAWVNFKLKNDPATTLDFLEKSKIAYCDWLKAIGASDCSPPPRYATFKKIIETTPYKKPEKSSFVQDPDPVNILKQLITLLEQDNILEVLIAASAFEQQTMILQKERFYTACQFHPWNEVYPPFFDGVTLIKRDPNDPILQAKALLKFKEALEKLTQPPEQFKGSCWGGKNTNLLQELQMMNNSDTPKQSAKEIKSGGGKPW